MTLHNTITQLRIYFSTPEKPVMLQEFLWFWDSLSFDDIWYFRTVDLETGLSREMQDG